MADEVRTLLARLRPELDATKFQSDLKKVNDSVVGLGRTAEGVFAKFEDLGKGKVSGDKIVREIDRVIKKNDEAVRSYGQYEAALEQLQKVSQYLTFSQLSSQVDGLNSRFRTLPSSVKITKDQIADLVAGSVGGLKNLQAEALLTQRALQSAGREAAQAAREVKYYQDQANAGVRQTINRNTGVSTVTPTAGRADRRADAEFAFSGLPTQTQEAQKLVTQYNLVGAAIDKVKADQAALNALLANTGPIKGSTEALAAMTRQLQALEKEQQGAAKGAGNLYRQNQILQAGLINTFQSLAAGQSVMSTLFVQSTQLVGAFGAINTSVLLVGAGVAVTVASFVGMGAAIAKVGDEATQAKARINAFLNDIGETERVYLRLQQLGSQTGVGANESGGLFSRLLVGGQALGATNDEVLRLVENFQKLGTIGGGSVQQINAGMQQFVQAMSKGRLDGDELRSIFENLPQVARVLSQELGKSNAELRAMGAQGTLTSEVVFRAILNRSQEIDRTFANMPVTMARAWNILGNETERLLVALDRALGISNLMAAAFQRAAGVVSSIRTGLGLATEAETAEAQIARAAETEALSRRIEAMRRNGASPTELRPFERDLELRRYRYGAQDTPQNIARAQALVAPPPENGSEPTVATTIARTQAEARSAAALVQARELAQSLPGSRERIETEYNERRRTLSAERDRLEQVVAQREAALERNNAVRSSGIAVNGSGGQIADTQAVIQARRDLTTVTDGLTAAEAKRNAEILALSAGARREAAAAQREIEQLETAIERANTSSERRQTSTEVRGYLAIADAVRAYREAVSTAAQDQGLLTRATIAQASALDSLRERLEQERRALESSTVEAENRNEIIRLEALGTSEARAEIDRIAQARALEAIEIQRGNDLRKLNIDLNAATASGATELVASLREQIDLRNQLYDRQRAAATDPIQTSAARETIENQRRALDGATKAASDFFYDAFTGKTSDIGKKLSEALKRGIADSLAEEFVRPLLRPLIQGVIGSGTGTGAGTGLLSGLGSLLGFNDQQAAVNQSIQINQGNAAFQNAGSSISAGTRFTSGGTFGVGANAQPVFDASGVTNSPITSLSTASNTNRVASFSGTRIFTPGYQFSGLGPANGIANYTFGDAATGVGTAELSSGLGQVSVGQFAGSALGILGGGYGIYSGLQQGGARGYTNAASGAVGVVGGVAGLATAANVAGAGVAAAGAGAAAGSAAATAGAGVGLAGTAIAATAAWAPYIAAIIAIVALLIPEDKPSNREGNATLNTDTGEIILGGQTGKKISYENRDSARKLAEGVRGFTDEIDKLVGFNVRAQLVVGVGDRDGLFFGENGRSRTNVANNQEGALAAVEGLSRIVLERAAEQTSDLVLRQVINVALQGSSLEALEDIRWYKDVYQKIGQGPVAAVSDLQKTFDALDESFRELREKINSFGISTEALDFEVQRQRDLILKQRDEEYIGSIEGFRLRRDQVNPNFSQEQLELKVFDIKAAEERKTATQRVFNLGLEGTQQSLWYMAELEETLVAERLAIQRKYTQTSVELSKQQAEAINRSAQELLERLTYGELGGLSPDVRYALGRQSLDEVKSRLYDADGATNADLEAFTEKASELLPQFKEFLGISSEYGGLAAEVANIITTLRPEADPAQLVPVLLQQTLGLSQVEMALLQTGQANAELLTKILTELARLTAQNQALLDRTLGR
jgi:tape measure domain-containing protein